MVVKHTPFLIIFAVIFLLSSIFANAETQPRLIKDYQTEMEIPELVEVAASPVHLYTMSEENGLSVFRTSSDTLQYLFTNPGMERRGHRIKADARYGYLFGKDDTRLTILDPTTVLGVFSSTYLPSKPADAQRINNHLLVAMEEDGVGHLSLETPEAVDTEPEILIESTATPSLAGTGSRIFALVDEETIYHFEQQGDTLSLSDDQINLEFNAAKLFWVQNKLWASTQDGSIYQIDQNGGDHQNRFEVDEPVERFDFWNALFVIRSESGLVWIADEDDTLHEFRTNPDNRNLFAVSKSMLWMSEGRELLQLHREEQLAYSPDEDYDDTSQIQLASIDDVTMPQNRPVLIPIRLENNIPEEDVRFRYESTVDNAEIKGNGFFWQPTSRQTGRNQFTIYATTRDGHTDSTSFEVDVKRFNSPPRFTPVRPVSIVAEEEYSMPIEARDPDGTHPDLIRYIGVDLPNGADLDERTGEFTWTPHRRQVGTHTFEVIATDQYGAASTLNIEITVKELDRD